MLGLEQKFQHPYTRSLGTKHLPQDSPRYKQVQEEGPKKRWSVTGKEEGGKWKQHRKVGYIDALGNVTRSTEPNLFFSWRPPDRHREQTTLEFQPDRKSCPLPPAEMRPRRWILRAVALRRNFEKFIVACTDFSDPVYSIICLFRKVTLEGPALPLRIQLHVSSSVFLTVALSSFFFFFF